MGDAYKARYELAQAALQHYEQRAAQFGEQRKYQLASAGHDGLYYLATYERYPDGGYGFTHYEYIGDGPEQREEVGA